MQAFEKVGADVVYAPSLPSLEVIRTLCESVARPVNSVMGFKPPVFSVEELQEAGVRRISVGRAFARAALGAFVRAAQEVKEAGTFTYSAEAIAGGEISQYMAKPGRERR